MKNGKKQAVVIVHGIGEQRPMETVREFVETVWAKDSSLKNSRFWSKPSEVSQSYEQRRLTTDYAEYADSSSNKKTSRVDFYEYYWAHKTVGTTFEHLKSWFLSLLFRSPINYPKTLLPIYYSVWGLIFLSIPLLIYLIWPTEGVTDDENTSTLGSLFSTLWPLVFPALTGAIITVCVAYLGDIARYVVSLPSNIRVRQDIRQGGIELLESIEQTGKYDRIILVGHSLGSIIAYDMLSQLWARHNKFKNEHGEPLPLCKDALDVLDEMEKLTGADLEGSQQVNQQANYRQLQGRLYRILKHDCERANSATGFKHKPWLISDFITLGSPLTYADFLMYQTKEQFEQRKADRQLPTSPPVKENAHFCYTESKKSFLHHSAVFAPVKWTNIYSPNSRLICGDIISGPVADVFNCPSDKKTGQSNVLKPIVDIAVPCSTPGWFPNLLTHTNYWKWHSDYEDDSKVPAHIKALREALDLKMLN